MANRAGFYPADLSSTLSTPTVVHDFQPTAAPEWHAGGWFSACSCGWVYKLNTFDSKDVAKVIWLKQHKGA